MKDLIELYCRRRGIPEPHSNTEMQKVLTRMKDIGLINDDDVRKEKSNENG